MAKKVAGKGSKGAATGSSRVIKVDMAGVESGGLVPEGDYVVAVSEISQEVGQDSGKPYLKWKLKVSQGDSEGSTLYHQTSLQPQALFNLKATLIALGVSVPDSLMKLNLDELEGLEMGVSVGHEVYDGKKRAKVVDVFPLEDEGASSDEEEDDEEEDDEEDEVDLEAMGLEELLAFAKEKGIKLTKKDQKTAKKARTAIEAALEEEDDEDDV